MAWSGFSDVWQAGWREIIALRMLRTRSGQMLAPSPKTWTKWVALSTWPLPVLLLTKFALAHFGIRFYARDWYLVAILALTNLGMFGAAVRAWDYALQKSATIDAFIASSPNRDDIVRPIRTGLKLPVQLILPMTFGCVPVVVYVWNLVFRHLQPGRGFVLMVEFCWSMFLYGNVTWWLLVPPFVIWRIRRAKDLEFRWHDPARTPGVRTLAEGFGNTAIYLGLAAIIVTIPRYLLPRTSVSHFIPALYIALFVTSIWVGLATQVALYLIVRKAKLEELDRISSTLIRPTSLHYRDWDDIGNHLSSYSIVSSSTILPYGSSSVLQFGTAVVGAVAGFLLQFIHP